MNAPKLASRNRPVIVYIHGGNFMIDRWTRFARTRDAGCPRFRDGQYGQYVLSMASGDPTARTSVPATGSTSGAGWRTDQATR